MTLHLITRFLRDCAITSHRHFARQNLFMRTLVNNLLKDDTRLTSVPIAFKQELDGVRATLLTG